MLKLKTRALLKAKSISPVKGRGSAARAAIAKELKWARKQVGSKRARGRYLNMQNQTRIGHNSDARAFKHL